MFMIDTPILLGICLVILVGLLTVVSLLGNSQRNQTVQKVKK